MTEPRTSWVDENQRALVQWLAAVRSALERHAERRGSQNGRSTDEASSSPAVLPAALGNIVAIFALSPFERDVLLMCAGMELDSSFAEACAKAHGDAARAYPTFGLALASLDGAHWSALSPAAPLRRRRLVALAGDSVSTSPLRIDERILHELTGVQTIDESLMPYVDERPCAPLHAASHNEIASEIARRLVSSEVPVTPALLLCGPDSEVRRDVVGAACRASGSRMITVAASRLPLASADLHTAVTLLEREAMLSGAVLFVEDDGIADGAVRENIFARFVGATAPAVVLSTRERGGDFVGETVTIDVPQPTLRESAAIERPLRDRARARLGALARRVETNVEWEDLVLPEQQLETLHRFCDQIRQRDRVYEEWGFAERGPRGLGIAALFAGPPGTGKTLAAEVVARELGMDLYRIDLSQVINKYIGETEKNLARVFDAADGSTVMLFFDEADALFGKRSEVRDSHDRYANIEVGYLLTRMEDYHGAAILATNLKNTLDQAFARRLRFSVAFPFPDVAQRREIWQRIFPARLPLDGVDVAKLAQLNVPGGSIRNIALDAAFRAAAADEPVQMRHLSAAARAECEKLERPIAVAELWGWL